TAFGEAEASRYHPRGDVFDELIAARLFSARQVRRLFKPREKPLHCFRIAKAMADAGTPGVRHIRLLQERLEEADATETDIRRNAIERQHCAGKGQHLIESYIAIGLSQELNPGLIELGRAFLTLTEDR